MDNIDPSASVDDLATTTGRLLVRSGIEIGHTLEAMRADGDLVTAELEQGERIFLSHVLHVDADAGWFAVACSDSKEANLALLASASTNIACNHRGAHYEFVAPEPREMEHAGAAAIRFRLPVALLTMQRRSRQRAPLPPSVPLRCEIPWGRLTLDAQVVDISLGGLGTLVYDPGVHIEPGARLSRVRIIHPERRPVLVELEVRYSVRITLRDGRPAIRSGCRFVGARKDLEDLIRLFVTDLDAPPPAA